MSFLAATKSKIGDELFLRLEKVAEKEVAVAIQMPLKDQYNQDQYYRPQFFLLKNLLDECRRFEELQLKISPADVVGIFFKSKLLFASQNRDEYMKRIGGGMHNNGLWRDKELGTVDAVVNLQFERLEDSLAERTLLTEVNSFQGSNPNLAMNGQQRFFTHLFGKLAAPFAAFFDDGQLFEQYKALEVGLNKYEKKKAREYFCAPSIGFKCYGSEIYCYWHAAAWLRVFFNILRIAGFIHPGQMDFGDMSVHFFGPKTSVFLGTYSQGCYNWQEDQREPWAKSPDGSLFLSFGYRGLSKMWLDVRTYSGIEQIFLANKKIFESLKNPWAEETRRDVMPTLDILSSATQMPDIGAKTLLVYCCLEHLFVPPNVKRDNKKYIVGGINAVKPGLLPWFERLNDLRNEFAHKGFLIVDEKSRGLVIESMKNVLSLLIAKLANA